MREVGSEKVRYEHNEVESVELVREEAWRKRGETVVVVEEEEKM